MAKKFSLNISSTTYCTKYFKKACAVKVTMTSKLVKNCTSGNNSIRDEV